MLRENHGAFILLEDLDHTAIFYTKTNTNYRVECNVLVNFSDKIVDAKENSSQLGLGRT